MKRRAFVQAIGSAAAGAFVAPLRGPLARPRGAAKLERVGLELYAVREPCAPIRSARSPRCAPWGTTTSSFSGRSTTSAARRNRCARRSITKDSGRRRRTWRRKSSCKDWDKSLETRQATRPPVSDRPEPSRRDAAFARRVARNGRTGSTPPAPRRGSAGIWLAFHNEPDHMKPIDGVGAVRRVHRRASIRPSCASSSTSATCSWAAAIRCAISRRIAIATGASTSRTSSPTARATWSSAQGTFDFARFLAAVPDLAYKPCYVEQENPSDEMASARTNCEYLRRLTFG